METENRVDVLVSNAGIWQKADILDVTEETFDKFVGVNIKGAFFAVKAVTSGGIYYGKFCIERCGIKGLGALS